MNATAQRSHIKEIFRNLNLIHVVRWIGGCSLLLSAVSFLLGGWLESEPLIRYYSFLGLTTLLTAAGIFCGIVWKEDKGARTFLSIATAFTPALFAQLGAMFFAQYSYDVVTFPSHYHFLQFDSIGASTLWVNTGWGVVLMIGIMYLGFSSMIRTEGRLLTELFLLSNMLLLIPVRNGDWVAAIALVNTSILIFLNQKLFSKNTHASSWDGLAMRGLLFVPSVVMVVRTLVLPYPPSSALSGLLALSVFAGCFFLIPNLIKHKKVRCFFQLISFLPLGVAWSYALETITPGIYYFGDSAVIPFLVLPYLLLVALCSFRMKIGGVGLRKLVAVFFLMSIGAQLFINGGDYIIAVGLLLSVALMVLSFYLKEKSMFVSGVVALGLIVLFHFRHIIGFYDAHLWYALAITGTVLLFLSSYLEKNWKPALVRYKSFQSEWKSWS